MKRSLNRKGKRKRGGEEAIEQERKVIRSDGSLLTLDKEARSMTKQKKVKKEERGRRGNRTREKSN